MKILIFAIAAVLTACAATDNDARIPSSVADSLMRPVQVRCGRGSATPGRAYLPEMRDCSVTLKHNKADKGGRHYFLLDCSAHPIRFENGGKTYESPKAAKDLQFYGMCGAGAELSDCSNLGGVNFHSLNQASPAGRLPKYRGANFDVPELHNLKSKDGSSIKLIVGKSADGSALVAKGIFRGCTISE